MDKNKRIIIDLESEEIQLLKNGDYIKGYNNRYIVTKDGRIYSLYDRHNYYRIKELTYVVHGGYKTVMLSNKKANRVLVHRIVAETFIPNPNNLHCVNHKDENKLNNNVDNLEWCDYKYNNNYSRNISEWNKERGNDIIVYDSIENKFYKFNSIREATKELHVDRAKFTKTINTDNYYNNRYKSAYGKDISILRIS